MTEMLKEMTREQLAKNRKQLAVAYRKYYVDLCQYFIFYTHNKMSAEDMVQDLFLKVMAIDLIRRDTVKNLLFVMARRMIIDDARHKAFVRQAKEKLQDDVAWYDVISPLNKLETTDILSLLDRHLTMMAPRRACIYRMYHKDEFSSKEISEKLNISQRTVETHLYYASKDMKCFLKEII